MNIGLTGGIASGKSTVAGLLARKGAHIVDADRIAREVAAPGSPVLASVADRFGADVLLPDGSLNRPRLGEIIFADSGLRKELEAIMHPPIRRLMLERMQALELEHPDGLVVVDVPLLFESGLAHYFQQVMLVYVPRELQLSRLRQRDGLDGEQAERRLAAQMDMERKRELADIIIDNSGTVEQTAVQLDRFWAGKGLA